MSDDAWIICALLAEAVAQDDGSFWLKALKDSELPSPAPNPALDDEDGDLREAWHRHQESHRLPAEPCATAMRSFDGGATRNTAEHKYDFEGFYHPLVVQEFGRYMHSHRLQADGNLRASDNWQNGIPCDVYMKSTWRHFLDLWLLHRGEQPLSADTGAPVDVREAICALLFNLQGYLYEHLTKPASV